MAFAGSQSQVRPKIIQLLLRYLSENLEQLLPSQLLHLSNVLLSTGEANDGSTVIKGIELDKFIIHNIGALTAEDLVLAVEIFAESSLLNVQEALETQLV